MLWILIKSTNEYHNICFLGEITKISVYFGCKASHIELCTSTLVGHFGLSPREKEKRDRRRDKSDGQGRKGNEPQ